MPHRSKYLVLRKDFDYPIVFSELMTHSDVAKALGGEILGAGFCYIRDDRYICYGESTSCRVKSRDDEDSKILNYFLGADAD